MITSSNLPEILESIDKDTLLKVTRTKKDYVMVDCIPFNGGFVVTCGAVDYSEDLEQELNDEGQLFCTIDSFLELLCEHCIEY